VSTVRLVGKRNAQRDQTRLRILEALVESLIDVGYAKTTTVEVQRRADVSRGALLHHFPTRDELFEEAVRFLVGVNERAVREALVQMPEELLPLDRAIGALAQALRQPAYAAELELWMAARTDSDLRAVLRKAERRARRDLNRVVAELFGEPWSTAPRFPLVSELTITLLRGLATSRALRADSARESALIAQWTQFVRELLDAAGT
jgi:AcrR family transcriptional regulator